MNRTQASDQARVAVAGYSDGYRDGFKRSRKELRKLNKRVAELQAFYRDAITEVTSDFVYREVSNRVAERMANDHAANTGDDSLKDLVDMMKVIDQAMRGMEHNAKQPGEPEKGTDDFDLPADRPSTQFDADVRTWSRDPEFKAAYDEARNGQPEGSEQDDPDLETVDQAESEAAAQS